MFRILVLIILLAPLHSGVAQTCGFDLKLVGFAPTDTVWYGSDTTEGSVVPLPGAASIHAVRVPCQDDPRKLWVHSPSIDMSATIVLHPGVFTVVLDACHTDSVRFEGSPLNDAFRRMKVDYDRVAARADSLRGDRPPHVRHWSDTLVPAFCIEHARTHPDSYVSLDLLHFLQMTGWVEADRLKRIYAGLSERVRAMGDPIATDGDQ